MNTQDKIYVSTDFVPERNKDKITVGKIYEATRVSNKEFPSCYNILADSGVIKIINIKGCAYLDGMAWKIISEELSKDEKIYFGTVLKSEDKQYTFPEININIKEIQAKEQAWKLLAFGRLPFRRGITEHVSLMGMYTKEYLEAIILLWDDLGEANDR